ncbi:NMD protein affecting ribosome stability and mRNA decay [Sulfolobus sp. S-194]|uniref:60S ribosomal export protein NMD3 n=1 Tax=Sulfolobus sp. S-194 TaxID=2512240 RepID=UPI001436D03C|nr:60S ribosomal export protein NMD3 [Sulfolobus sp. S-194]QIW23381.1 NMD protein affecting ribosome stability and mRNA decay [Sulfolobus sp. S-194]
MARKFCVLCGREEGEFIGSLCIDCYIKTKEIVSLPESIKGKYCKLCGAEWVNGKWIRSKDRTLTPVESIIYREIGKKIEVDPNVEEISYQIENIWKDVNGHTFVTLNIEGKIRGKPFTLTKVTDLNIERTLCTFCIRKKSRYYEAIIQLRFKEGKFDAKKRTVFESFFTDDIIDSLSDVVEGKEGVDYYFINKTVAKRLVSNFTSMVKDVKIMESYQDETIRNGKKFAKLVISVRV